MTDARLERLRVAIEELVEERDRLLSEAKDLMKERDEARVWAEAWRDGAYQEMNAEERNGFKFPWESDQ